MQVLGNRQSKSVVGETESGGYGNSLYYTWNSPISPKLVYNLKKIIEKHSSLLYTTLQLAIPIIYNTE